MDIMIALVVFLGTIFLFYSILSSKYESKSQALEDDASKVAKNIATEDSGVAVIDGVAVDVKKLEQLLGRDYSEIKGKIRAKNEFCIFFEDENGNLIKISPEYAGVGSEKIKVNNVPCG